MKSRASHTKESPVLPVAMRKGFGAAGLATLRAGGFKEVMTKESVALEEQVYQALRAMNVVCTLEHGNWIDIPAMEAGHSWCVGTANENWGCDYNDDAGCNIFSIELDFNSGCPHVQLVAEAIAKTVREPAELHQLRETKRELLVELEKLAAWLERSELPRNRRYAEEARAAIINAGGGL